LNGPARIPCAADSQLAAEEDGNENVRGAACDVEVTSGSAGEISRACNESISASFCAASGAALAQCS